MTLHETVVSMAPLTVAVKVCVLPKSSEDVAGNMVTVTAEGVGGGAGDGGIAAGLELAVLPAQPRTHPDMLRTARMRRTARRGCAVL